MFQDPRQRLNHRVLLAAFIVFAQDLCSRGGAQAWTYNYSIGPNRRYLDASQWCQQHFTDMVVIQNQEESDFLNDLLPFNPKYYWIGIRKVHGEWVRDRIFEKVPEVDQNWAPEEPDNIAGQDCVEIYIKREKDTAKWNNENCRKKKGTICYSASCRQDSCSAHADCVETIGNYTCQCHPGFLGSRCEEAIACKPLLDPEQASHYCFHPYGSNRFNSSCLFHCELGFQLVGVPQLQCQVSGHWDHPVPLCQVEQCPVVNDTSVEAGRVNCSHPIAPFSYNSTCEVRCDEGYEPSGQDLIHCDHTGQWTASVPACTMIKCSPVWFPVTGDMTCVHTLEPFSFGSWCNFTCQDGYHLTGDSSRTCLASGQWSKPTPACTVVRCSSLKPPSQASMQCQDPLGVYSYGSICTVQCDEGFDLIGINVTQCLSHGNWSHALPVCKVKRCDPINLPHGTLSCSDPIGSFSFGSRCKATCDEGFLLNGTASTECSSLGTWSADTPRCSAKKCPLLNHPAHASLICSDSHQEFSFGSRCNITCQEGFFLNGTADTECTSVGRWSADIPRCLAQRCPSLNPPSHGSLICSDPHKEFSFGSRCNITCEEGFFLNGTADTECTAVGVWSEDVPRCLAQRCPALNSPPRGSIVCSAPYGEFSFGSRCTSTCEEGFVLNGTADTECTSLGKWSADIPRCLAKRCFSLNSPPHGSVVCSAPHGEFSFGSHCTSTCDEGFVPNGTAATECTTLGTWSAEIPHCLAQPCPLLAKAPHHGRMNCSHPYSSSSYGSRCDFECNEGFRLRGSSVTTCNTSGHWSQDVPSCQQFSFGSRCNITCEEGFFLNGTADTECTAVGVWSEDVPRCLAQRCPALNSPPRGSIVCSAPYGEFSFGSRCTSTCEEGFVLNGTADIECTSLGKWSADIPRCLAKRCFSLNSPPHGYVVCSAPHGEFSFGSHCTSTCDEGFVPNGTAATECTTLGTWSAEIPHCLAQPCPLLAKAPHHGRMNCSHPYSSSSYGSRCDFECNEGFRLRGSSVTTCNTSGHWSRDVPSCQPVQCEALRALPLPLSVNCSHPLGKFSVGSQCLFTCKEGFSLNGTEALFCSSAGFWNHSMPTCTEEGMPLGAAMLMYTGVGAASVVVPLILIGLCFFIMTRVKKRGNALMSDPSAWEERENPAFEF